MEQGANLHLQLIEELARISADHLELVAARLLNDLPPSIVGRDRWDDDSLRDLLRRASERIPDEQPNRQSRRKAARLALGVEPGKKSLKSAVLEMGLSEREAQPSRRGSLDPLWHDMAIALLEMSYETLRPAGQFEVLTEEGAVTASLIRHIDEECPQSARFLELSAASVSHVLASAIRSSHVQEVQLLVADPRLLSPFHWKTRMLPALCEIQLTVERQPASFKGPAPITIRCYGFRDPVRGPASCAAGPDVMPSLRGRKLGKSLVSLGWYTYSPPRQNTQDADSSDALRYPVREVWGHENPVLMARPEDTGFNHLCRFFDQQFDALWNGCPSRRIPPAVPLSHVVAERDPDYYEGAKGFLAQVGREG